MLIQWQIYVANVCYEKRRNIEIATFRDARYTVTVLFYASTRIRIVPWN